MIPLKYDWCVTFHTSTGPETYYSSKRILASAVSDCMAVHTKAIPNEPVVQMAARRTTHKDIQDFPE